MSSETLSNDSSTLTDTDSDSSSDTTDITDEEYARRLQTEYAEELIPFFRLLPLISNYQRLIDQDEAVPEDEEPLLPSSNLDRSWYRRMITDTATYEDLCRLSEFVPPVCRGLDEQIVASWSTMQWTRDIPETCTICLDSYQDNDTLLILPCDHRFHKDCVLPWFKDNHVCPICRSSFEPTT